MRSEERAQFFGQHLPNLLLAVVAAVAAVVLVGGWILGFAALTYLVPGLAVMVP